MIVTIVEIHVTPDRIDDFIAATTQNHRRAIEELGNLRFDVLHSRADPCRFFLYEAYESDDAAAEHKNTAHYLRWRDDVESMMAQPRQGISCDVIHPREPSKW